MSTSRKGRPRKRKPSRPAAPPRAEQTPPLKEKAGGGRSRAILVGVVGVVIAAAAVYFLRDAGEPSAPGKQAPSAERGRIRFENRQPASGIDFVLNNGTTDDKPVIDSTFGGVAVFDYNNDGRLDVFFTNGAHIPSLKKTSKSFHNRLYENQGNGKFADVTEAARLAGSGYSMGAAVGDYDNDGWSDLYVTGVNVNALYRNTGKDAFTDVTAQAGVTGRFRSGRKPWSVASAWVDYDSDGHLDLFVVNYLDWSFAKNKLCGDPGKRLSCSPALYDGLPNMLYRNNADGTFTDVSTEAGIAAHIGKGMSAAIRRLRRRRPPRHFRRERQRAQLSFPQRRGQALRGSRRRGGGCVHRGRHSGFEHGAGLPGPQQRRPAGRDDHGAYQRNLSVIRE